ncbi:MAG TPA: serpin family protein [Thermomicrobiales bacterium]|nr:serpin family protein [Thermomicrobiales bacterium]
MITSHPRSIDRRSLIARSVTAAAVAGLLQRQAFASQASPSPEASGDAIAQLVAGNTAFVLDLYREFRDGVDGNIVFSPYSVSMALAMVFAGARGETADQMATSLGFSLSDPEVQEAFQALTSDLTKRGAVDEEWGKADISIANALWGEQTFPFSDAFIKEMETYYEAGLQLTDFVGDAEGAREEINAWVAEKTGDHIKDIVPEGVITAATRLVLANAIYFASNWQSRFDKDDTVDETFHLIDGTTVDTSFMVQTKSFPYVKADGAQIVELPYVAEGFAMTIALPDEGQFDAFEDGLDAAAFAGLVGSYEWTTVELHLPKFEFDLGQSLNQMLKSLGMTALFDPEKADLSGMTGEGTDEKLAVSDVLHEAFISVDEAGTEAAAATVVAIEATSAPVPEETVVLEVDRPFLFAIRDTETGTVLFFGRVMNPARD